MNFQGNIFGVVIAVFMAFNTFLTVWGNRKNAKDNAAIKAGVAEVHKLTNSMKDELVIAVKESATMEGHAAGLIEGEAKEIARNNEVK